MPRKPDVILSDLCSACKCTLVLLRYLYKLLISSKLDGGPAFDSCLKTTYKRLARLFIIQSVDKVLEFIYRYFAISQQILHRNP